ncbi:MAG: WhiB family transcriptional regulator [Chloroflexi bacterium]|nr:WhiB family transcriptional regulator [Chloroflexota bacterium]
MPRGELAIEAADFDWQDHAACGGQGHELFFSVRGLGYAPEAVEICRACPVREACLSFAIETNQDFGLWGGLGPGERRLEARRRRQRVSA